MLALLGGVLARGGGCFTGFLRGEARFLDGGGQCLALLALLCCLELGGLGRKAFYLFYMIWSEVSVCVWNRAWNGG